MARLGLGFAKLTGINTLLAKSFNNTTKAGITANKHLFSFRGWKSVFQSASSSVGEFIGKMGKLSTWINGLKTILRVAISPIKMLFMGLGSVIVFLLSPIGLLGTAFVTAGVLIYRNWEKVKAFFAGFLEGLRTGLQPVIDKFKPLVDWIESAFNWFMKLLSPVQSTKEDLDAAASAGKKFGEWLAAGIDLVTKPLQWLMDSIQWVIDHMPSIEKFAKEYGNRIDNTATMAANVGFASGGYVGNGGKYEPMGIVHGGEYVMTKETTSRLGVPLLNALNYGKNALLATGLSMSVATAAPIQVDSRPPLVAPPAVAQSVAQPMAVNITINAAPGQDERAIARMVAQEMQRIQNQQQARQRSSMRDRD